MKLTTDTVTRKIRAHRATLRIQKRKSGKDRIVVIFTEGPHKGVRKERTLNAVLKETRSLNPKRIFRNFLANV